jgi:hypothetical protein
LQAEDAIAEVSEDEKKNIEYLQNMPIDKALSIRSLVFQLNRKGYYRPDAVARYFDKLGNLEFVEVRDKGGQFICYIPIQFFKKAKSMDIYDRFDRSKISGFVDAVASGNVEQVLQGVAVTLKVKSNDSLVTVLRLMRREHTTMAAVLSESGRYFGPIFSRDVEKKVADAVLTSNVVQ